MEERLDMFYGKCSIAYYLSCHRSIFKNEVSSGGDGMIDKLRELFNDWMKEKKWKKDVGDPLYVYEIYEFLDYVEERKEDSLKW